MPFSDPIVAGDVLVRAAISSPDYVPGLAGWTITADGVIEVADLTIRGGEGRYIRGYVTADTAIPVLDFHPSPPADDAWSATAGSMYQYPDGAGYEVLGISSPVQLQPATTGEARLELRSGKAADATSAIVLTATTILHNSGLYVLRGQRGSTNVTAAGSPSATVAVVFPVQFPAGSTVQVVTNINSGAGSTARCQVRAINITVTGFTIFVESSATGVDLAWVAVPVGWLATIN